MERCGDDGIRDAEAVCFGELVDLIHPATRIGSDRSSGEGGDSGERDGQAARDPEEARDWASAAPAGRVRRRGPRLQGRGGGGGGSPDGEGARATGSRRAGRSGAEAGGCGPRAQIGARAGLARAGLARALRRGEAG